MKYQEKKIENDAGVVSTLFKDPANAEHAYKELLNRGYKPGDITLVMSEDTHQNHFLNHNVEETQLKTKSVQGIALGGAIGTTLGALAAGLAAVGAPVTIPALGIVVGGSLSASLAGAGAGAVAGGLLGAFIGLGIPEDEAKEYEAGINAGGVLISVRAQSPEDYKILRNEWKKMSKMGISD